MEKMFKITLKQTGHTFQMQKLTHEVKLEEHTRLVMFTLPSSASV